MQGRLLPGDLCLGALRARARPRSRTYRCHLVQGSFHLAILVARVLAWLLTIGGELG